MLNRGNSKRARLTRCAGWGVAEDPRKRVWRQGGAPQGRLCAVLV
jgi:hypothetical protein